MSPRIAFGAALLVVLAVVSVLVATGGEDSNGGGDCGEAIAELAGTEQDLSAKPEIEVPDCATPTELETVDLVEGDGAELKSGDTARFEYVGVTFDDGSEFDTSWGREPLETQIGVGGVIPGWDEGIPGMKEGGRRMLVIPSDQAYGSTGQPPDIGPDEALVFVVDLLEVR